MSPVGGRQLHGVPVMSSSPHVKICCIRDVAEARIAIDYGASAIGLVSAMPSGPGVISESDIAEVAAAILLPTRTFLLTSLTDAGVIAEQHARLGTTTLQLVDTVTADGLALLREYVPAVELVQVIHVVDESSIQDAIAVAPLVDAILLDSGRPRAAVKELGGTGRVHDWKLSRQIRESVTVPVYLAGGLNPGLVAEAWAAVQPYGFDVCSGLRTEGGLDESKLALFMDEVGQLDT
jgi:phosphoribosylanthranilate isomerase